MVHRLILGSSSPRRRELVAALGIPFTIEKPEVDETQAPGEAPLDYVRRLSQQKAAAIADRLDGAGTVLGADTVVILGADTLGIDGQGDILGKPGDADEARRMLKALRGREHQVWTAITLRPVGAGAPEPLTTLTRTLVTMRDYGDDEIEAYVASGDPFDKAGSYAIQHAGFRPVARLDGCYTNVMGLPLCALRDGLARLGWPGFERAATCDCAARRAG